MNLEQPEVLVVRGTAVSQEFIDNNESLQLIVRAGNEIENIDFAHCSTKGIYVANTPGKNSNAVAELTMGLMLSIDRRIACGVNKLRAGEWDREMQF